MTTSHPSESTPPGSLGSPDHDRGGSDIDEAVAESEDGSQVEGVHKPAEPGAAPGDSRLEQMTEVEGLTAGGNVHGDPDEATALLEPGPSPAEIGSGGAQRIVGARISDRVAAGQPVPDGPPFDTNSAGETQDTSGAGS